MIKINSYKYLYKIEYIGKSDVECKYYIGSRKSNISPKDDLLKRYMTSSKIINKLIKKEGKDVFKIVEIKDFNEEANIFHEEAKWLVSVDAKNSLLYFNQTNNEGYIDKAKVNRICPWCYKKNYGNPFEKCSYCGELMIIYFCNECGDSLKYSCETCKNCGYTAAINIKYPCKGCGNELNNPSERCLKCNYRVMDDITYECKQCGGVLGHTFEVCSNCGYSAIRDSNYKCKQCEARINNPSQQCNKCGYSPMMNCNSECKSCGNKLNFHIQKCDICGYSRADDFKYYCQECGNRLKHSLEHCQVCGTFARDKFNFTCQKCEEPLSNSTSRCKKCRYSVLDDAKFLCSECESSLENPMERCKECGYSRRDDIKFSCKNCGSGGLINSSSRCGNCGIIKAGCDRWRKFNAVYDLNLNGEIIFTGFREHCIDYLKENLVAEKRFLVKLNFFDGVPFEPKSKAVKYINQHKFKGLIAIKKVEDL